MPAGLTTLQRMLFIAPLFSGEPWELATCLNKPDAGSVVANRRPRPDCPAAESLPFARRHLLQRRVDRPLQLGGKCVVPLLCSTGLRGWLGFIGDLPCGESLTAASGLWRP